MSPDKKAINKRREKMIAQAINDRVCLDPYELVTATRRQFEGPFRLRFSSLIAGDLFAVEPLPEGAYAMYPKDLDSLAKRITWGDPSPLERDDHEGSY